ncbi:MAG: type IV secretory system conjugative DNA transfer family protein [Planctomycetia bacterium]
MKPSPPVFDLDRPLLQWSPRDAWTIRDACEGTQIFGATGCGKTSGSGRAIAKAFLRAGFGGLVLTAKPGEREEWERYAKETGRSSSVVVFAPGGRWRFNFMDYELRRPGAGAGLTDNLVNLFCTVLEAAERKGGGGGQNESFWERTLRQLLRNAVDLLAAAQPALSLQDVARLVAEAPASHEQARDPQWLDKSFCFQSILAGERRRAELSEDRRCDFETAARYWMAEFPGITEKTRSVIVTSFTSMADTFLRGILRPLFTTDTTILPEATHEGAVLIVDLPVKEYGDVGQFAQVLWKHLWQRAAERRPTADARPIFLWADESQNFVTSHDMQFQTTARSSRVCTVYLTQNLPNYYAVLPGEKGKHETDSLLGNLQTKIFHANGDSVTNAWASELLGKSFQTRVTTGLSKTADAEDKRTSGTSTSIAEILEYDVLPKRFHSLRKGGPQSGFVVEGVVFQPGRRWAAGGGAGHLVVRFDQRADARRRREEAS